MYYFNLTTTDQHVRSKCMNNSPPLAQNFGLPSSHTAAAKPVPVATVVVVVVFGGIWKKLRRLALQ